MGFIFTIQSKCSEQYKALQSICIPRAYKIMFFDIFRLVEGGDLQLQQEKGRRQL